MLYQSAEYLESMREQRRQEKKEIKNLPFRSQRDVLLFLLENAPLEPWQQDVLAIVRGRKPITLPHNARPRL